MNIQTYQLIIFIIWLVAIIAICWCIKKKTYKTTALIGFVLFVLFALNPVRHQVASTTKTLKNNDFKVVPQRVKVLQHDFNDHQNQEHSALKQQSEGLKDEIHN